MPLHLRAQRSERPEARQLGAEVIAPAREALTQALQVAATVSGVLIVAAAVIVAQLVRRGDEPQLSEDTLPLSIRVATQLSCA